MNGSLVLLHGFTGAPASWRPVLELLPPGTRHVAPALLGHGATVEPATSFDGEVDRIAAIARAAVPPRHLAGYSLGARVALGLLVRHPALFTRATLIGVNPGLRTDEERQARAASDRRWITLLERHGLQAFLDEWRALPMWATQQEAPPERLAEQRRVNRSHDARGLASSLRVLGLATMPDWRPHLPDVRVPVTLMTGALDTKFTALADVMAGELPRARRLTVAAAGHNLLLERPDAVADALNQDATHE